MDALTTKSTQFINLLSDKDIFISKCYNMIPRLLTAIDSIPRNNLLEHENSPLNGQLKSIISCHECGKETEKTESFKYLSLKIPKYRTIEYSLIDLCKTEPPKVYGCVVGPTANIKTLKHVIAENHGLSQTLLTSLKQVDKKDVYAVLGYIRNLCSNLSINMLPDIILSICVSFYFDGVSNHFIYICDIWKSKIHRQFRNQNPISDISRRTDDIYVYHSRILNVFEFGDKTKSLKHQPFVVNHEYEDISIGVPLLITLPVNVKISKKQIYERLWQINRPYLKDENVKIDDIYKPFEFFAVWGPNWRICERMTSNKDEIFDLENIHSTYKNVRFLIKWKEPQQYNMILITDRPRHKSAPLVTDEDGEQHELHLNKILNVFFEQSVCHKNECCEIMASRQYKLLNCPDLLIIHLQRFTNDNNENVKKVSNAMIKLPLNGLDLIKYVTKDDKQKMDTIYDCYAISNHNNDFGTNTGYIRNRNDDNWIYLDKNGNVSNVINIYDMMTSETYIAYYLKRDSNRKQDLLCFYET